VQIDSVIGHAQEAYTALRYQRTTFGDISSKIGALANRMPSVRFVISGNLDRCHMLIHAMVDFDT